MSEYYNVVPWFDSKQWLQVYEDIYVNHNHKAALELLIIWKARCPSLPSGVESTFTLLQVLNQDENSTSRVNDQLLRLAYSAAIMRFVNHMLDSETIKGSSLYNAAKNLGVPDWIIDMRHDTAHNNILPSIDLFREASQIALNWLDQNYWQKHKECITDYQIGRNDNFTFEDSKVDVIMNLCMSLSFCSHTKCNIKKISAIPNASLKESIVNDACNLFKDNFNFSNLKTVSISSLIKVMNIHSKNIFRDKNMILRANETLLGDDSLFLSLELVNYMSKRKFYETKSLYNEYVKCFEILLTFLHSNDMLLDFILKLIDITIHEENGKHKSLLAALWVSEILRSFIKLKKFSKRMKSTSTYMESKTQEELKSLYYHWFPNDKIDGLMLDMLKPVPVEFTDIYFIQPIISTYNPYLKYFIKELCNLVEPSLPASVTNKIYKLTELISTPENFPMKSSTIYTMKDINDEKSFDEKSNQTKTDNDDQNKQEEMIVEENLTEFVEMYGNWKLSTDNHNWASCPIGLLPWQN
ncbi:hypothetical protein ACJJTC_017956 [Scirpophaga incertulas]